MMAAVARCQGPSGPPVTADVTQWWSPHIPRPATQPQTPNIAVAATELTVQVEAWFKSMSECLTITEMRTRTGTPASAMRFYERKGLLRPVGRHGGKRVDDAGAIEQLALIDLLKLAGFTRREIAEMVDPEGRVAPGWRDAARAKLAELDRAIDEIQRARTVLQHTVDCPEDSLSDCPVHTQIVKRHAAQLADRSVRSEAAA